MPNLYLDIETIPAQRPEVLEEIRHEHQAVLDRQLADIRPPGNYKKQESIDEWMANEAPRIAANLTAASSAAVEEQYRRTGLDGAFGQVFCIGAALDDGNPKVFCAQFLSEAATLRQFDRWLDVELDTTDWYATVVVGHNVAAFDLRFLLQRSVVNQVRPHCVIQRAATAKPWEHDKVFDTMIQWAGVGNRIKLDKLCKALGLPGKGDITGADVWPMVQAGKWGEVVEYCMDDVSKVRSIHELMQYAHSTAVVERLAA